MSVENQSTLLRRLLPRLWAFIALFPLPLWAQVTLENPQPGSFQSGIGLISGWACEANWIAVQFNTLPPVDAAYGTDRGDTQGICGDTDNGFGLLFNWNLLGDGAHTVRVLADGMEFATARVTVTTLGHEFLPGVSGEITVPNFPEAGTAVVLRWQEAQQNFVITEANARVSEVLDGDTVRLSSGQTVRYFGLNTPEDGQPFADQAKRYNEQLVLGRQVRVVAARPEPDRYQRRLSYVYVGDSLVNTRLVSAGWAHVFILDPFDQAEDWLRLQHDAQAAGRGMWQAVAGPLKITLVRANAPGDDRTNPNGEYVRLCNVSPQPVELTGFAVQDAQKNRYVFPSGRLRPGYTALLSSGPGRNSVRNGLHRFHWGRGPVWNNAGDTAFVFDPHGRLIDSYTVRPRA